MNRTEQPERPEQFHDPFPLRTDRSWMEHSKKEPVAGSARRQWSGRSWAMGLKILMCHWPMMTDAQNLVPNPGFEELLQCPSGPSQLDGTAFWSDPSEDGSPDLFHTCGTATHGVPVNLFGFQEPADGEAYAGIFLYEGSSVLADWREYLQVELTEALVAGHCYHFSLHANLSDNSSRTTDALGVHFYMEEVQLPDPYPPGDEPHLELPPGTFLNTTDWTVLEGNYLASGGERFLMIGNYRDNANTTVQQLSTNGNFAYAFIDAISLSTCISTSTSEQMAMQPALLMEPDGIQLTGIAPGAAYRITDISGRLSQRGIIQGRSIPFVAMGQGVLLLSVTDGVNMWSYRVHIL